MRKNGKIIKCLVCGKEFYISGSLIGIRKYCSWECQLKAQVGKKLILHGKMIECQQCGKEFYCEPCNIRNGRKFCSFACRNLGRIGMKMSNETKIKMGKAHSGEKNYWHGKKFSEQHTQKLKESHVGHRASDATKKKMSERGKGRIVSIKTRKRLSISNRGENAGNWKGGISPIRRRLWECWKNKQWRKAIFERDNYICQTTRIKGKNLHPHHIVPFASILNEIKYAYLDGKITYERALKYDFLWDTENGITLSKDYHFEKHKLIRLTNWFNKFLEKHNNLIIKNERQIS